MSDIVIRRGTVQDVGLLAEMGAETFFDAYVEQIEEELLAGFVEETFGAAQQAAEVADEAVIVLIAESTGQAVAYALLREWEAAPEGLPPQIAGRRSMELGRIYARKAWIGRGVGSALMQACVDLAAERGFEMMWLGVWERNDRAIGFYRKWGFEELGDQVFMLGEERQRDVVMGRRTVEGRRRSEAP